MATQTVQIASFVNGAVTVSLSYDDVSLIALSLTGTNSSGAPAFAQATHEATGANRSRTVPVGGGSIALPATWVLTRGIANAILGLDWYLRWPA